MKKKLISSNRIYLIITNLIRIFIIIALVGAVLEKDWIILFVSILVLALTFLPSLIEKNYKIQLPIEFELIIIIFMYASLFLGDIKSYYTLFWWWDVILHIGSGIAFGFIGFLILYVLYKGDKIKAKPSTIAIFSFSFGLAIGTMWEIFEFAIDNILRTNLQKSGLVDTMWDLIVNGLGAFVASLIGYFYIKKERRGFFDKLITDFKKENPKLFRKK